MQLILNIPDDLIAPLREAHGNDLGRAAIEHLALAGFCAGKFSRYDVQRLLGFESRWETEDWLGRRGAHVQYSAADLDADRETLARILDR